MLLYSYLYFYFTKFVLIKYFSHSFFNFYYNLSL